MKNLLLAAFTLILFTNCSQQNKALAPSEKWVAIHLLDYTSDEKIEHLGNQLPLIKEKGINTIFLEIDYHFDFKSHPELRSTSGYVSLEKAKEFKKLCDENGIRLIPQFQSLGHQSWAETTYELLTVYPELDLTPGAYPNNKGIYCREWDPYNPRVNEIVFALIDEILEAFDAKGLHLGMDEVFLITKPEATSTKDKDPAEVFAKVVNDFHDYFTKQKGIELFIWGDRLIDGNVIKYGEWESSLNGTAPAIDMIPKDVVICDWHYEPANEYASVQMFIDKGFKVLPTSWRNPEGIEKLIKYSYALEHPNMLGHLFSTWGYVDSIPAYKPVLQGVPLIKSKKFYDVHFLAELLEDKQHFKTILSTRNENLEIYYTLDGSTPTTASLKYKEPLLIDKTTTIKALSFSDGIAQGNTTSKDVYLHKGMRSAVKVLSELSTKYEASNGNIALNDGDLGSKGFKDGKWVALEGNDLEVVFKFDTPTTINSINLRSYYQRGASIYPPKNITLFSSNDGFTFTKVKEVTISLSDANINEGILKLSTALTSKSIKIVATNWAKLELDYPTWMFVDEVIIN